MPPVRPARLSGPVAVLGAGVMGAQLAAHLASAGFKVFLYDLPDPALGVHVHARAEQALIALIAHRPPVFTCSEQQALITPFSLEHDLARLPECNWVIEAVSEVPEVKRTLYARIAPHLGTDALLTTNTSGLSVAVLADSLPSALRARFCAVHFFNPPRVMPLVELIAHPNTDAAHLDTLEGFITTRLGKDVIRALDTPGFIANRLGVFATQTALVHAERLGIELDIVDRLTGLGIGRPKSATLRTLDLVGLDTYTQVVSYFHHALTDDPWRAVFKLPAWLTALANSGALGEKTRAGIYRKSRGGIEVYRPDTGGYRRVARGLDAHVRAVLIESDPSQKWRALVVLDHPQAEFLRAVFRDLLHYAAHHLAEIAPSAREIDMALRLGYGWRLGPFEIWQALGWQAVARQLTDDIAAGRTLASIPLPAWVRDPARTGVHGPNGSYAPARTSNVLPSPHPVYARQIFPIRLLGETQAVTHTVYENSAARAWHQGDEVLVLSFKTRLNTISTQVIEALLLAIDHAERGYAALVLWQQEPPFSAGANLKEILTAAAAHAWSTIETLIKDFQRATTALSESRLPTVAAVQGLALGGGCELLMACDRRVAALESYIGLVEVGAGLIPAGGGCAHLARRAAACAAQGADLTAIVARYFEQVGQAKTSTSAHEAQDLAYLDEADPVVMHPRELLYVARTTALALAAAGYRPPIPLPFPVAGREAAATICAQLINLHAGAYLSAHDEAIGRRLARVLCGGDLDTGTRVDTEWMLRLEREAFMTLLQTTETQARIRHLLEHGKPLRN